MTGREKVHLLNLGGASDDDECVLERDRGNRSSDGKVNSVRAQVDQVIGVMKSNMNKVLERDVQLSNLQDRSDDLNVASEQFQVTARRTARRMWWKNIKMTVILVGVALAILLVIVIPIIVQQNKNSTH